MKIGDIWRCKEKHSDGMGGSKNYLVRITDMWIDQDKDEMISIETYPSDNAGIWPYYTRENFLEHFTRYYLTNH